MSTFIALQNTYNTIEIGLFTANDMLELVHIHKNNASSLLVPELQSLLARYNYTLVDIDFMVANQGPGPFTTLRVIIATLNGLTFTTQLPLIGIDGLQAFLMEQYNDRYAYNIALLNAFNKEVYVGILNTQTGTMHFYCSNIATVAAELASLAKQGSLYCFGNGVALYNDELKPFIGTTHSAIPNPLPETCSITTIARLGLEQWQTQQGTSQQLAPLYLKQL